MPKFALQLSLVRKPKTTNNEVPAETPDYVAIAAEAADRLATKLVIAGIVTVAAAVVLTALGTMANTALDHALNN